MAQDDQTSDVRVGSSIAGNDSSSSVHPLKSSSDVDENFRLKATLFLSSIAGMGCIMGFGSALAMAKKKDPEYFDKGVVPSPSASANGTSRALHESGVSLAWRALKWGTLWAVGGCGLIFYGAWKLADVKDLREFRLKMGGMLPRVPKNDPPQSRTEFSGIRDLLEYLVDEDKKKAK